ncbi:MAG TPA: septum formation initiator family protein [Chitinophagaceae bacterium]|nr:septum formation initiator family protein [Chitinophagaceae bacterium]
MGRKIPKWLKNRYFIVSVLFIVWITFFDNNDLIRQVGYISRLHELGDRKVYLENQIDSINHQLHSLKSDPKKLEKFAREKYLMKKPNEDVFIIKDASEND